MNWLNTTAFVKDIDNNPFTHWPFWGRQRELRDIYRHLLSKPPQSCVIIGETFIGKTTLLRYLASAETSLLNKQNIQDPLTFVYLDCAPYIALTNSGSYGSAQFWWDLYTKAQLVLKPGQPLALSKPKFQKDRSPKDIAYEIKSEIEDLIHNHQLQVIIVLDNFEGVAGLPIHDSEWLRSIVQHNRCSYVVASRHLLYLSDHHHPENIINPSPLWNLFSDPIYLGLLSEIDVKNFLEMAIKEAKKWGSTWKQDDLDFIRKFVGRHPELLRIACIHLFEQRLQPNSSLQEEERDFLEYSISKDASPICDWLWNSLTDPELRGEPRANGSHQEKEMVRLSPHQQVLLAISKGHSVTEIALTKETPNTVKEILFALDQRGLIEQKNGTWQVFSQLMSKFVLKHQYVFRRSGALEIAQASSIASRAIESASGPEEQNTIPAFTYLEDQVYAYLKSHTGKVCNREEIKLAVWKDYPPTNSALQKIIERIRAKIEPDPENPHYLIAVRGQGYMLRDNITSSTTL
jgi:hypothetical protein